jgi:hypothetical protein
MKLRKTFKQSLAIFLDSKYRKWSCKDCDHREKTLRGCTLPEFTDEYTHKPKFILEEKPIFGCPLGLINWELLGDALDSKDYYEAGFLPDEGTILDQTDFFILSSKIAINAFNKAEADSMKEIKEKR